MDFGGALNIVATTIELKGNRIRNNVAWGSFNAPGYAGGIYIQCPGWDGL